MRTLPTGTVTFLFTDIEGSTKLLRELGSEYRAALDEHRRRIRAAVARHRGVEVDTQGDAFFLAFGSPADAAEAAEEAQRALEAGPIHVRMGLHTGRPEVTDEGYVGLDVHKGARIAAAGHGGQIVLSVDTRRQLDDRFVVTDLGEHRLKDFAEPTHLFQLGDGTHPPLKTISNTNLPRPASSFVGREAEVRSVVDLLQDGARLLTLTGPGGSGKTRLAIEAATELIPDFRAGVFWAELAPIRDPTLVVETVGRSLGAKGSLAEHIGERELLLLIDNFEQVITAAPELADVVESCPNLRILVTSRELLRVRGEVEYPVPPLAQPEGVQLFCARSRLDPSDDIAELCARLDNLPLAVELAASRAKVLTPAQILERLATRLDLFKGGRDADPRQATLRATIEWSHDLLGPEEQRLFARLGVFVGDCALDAAEAICGADLDTLQSLVEKSLVRRTGDRFWMLETIREYAVERLERSGEADELRRRHMAYFVDLAGEANLWSDAEGPQRHELIEPEQDNVRAALDHALAAGDVEGAAQLAIRLENFLTMHNPFEATRRFEAILEAGAALSEDTRARLWREVSGARFMAGDVEGSDAANEESLALFRAIGDDAGVSEALHRMAVGALRRGEVARARALVEESRTVGRTTGRRRLEAINLGLMGDIECRDGNHDRGLEMLVRSAEIAHDIGFVWWEGVQLGIAAEHAVEVQRYDDAARWGRASLATLRAAGDRQNMVYGLALEAWIAALRDDTRRAGLLWGAIEAEEARGPIGAFADERDHYEAAVAAAEGPEFDEGRRAGRGLTLDQAVELALSDDGTGGTI